MSAFSLNSFRSLSLTVFALGLSSVVAAQTAPAGTAKKPAVETAKPAAKDVDPDLALAKKAALDWLALVDAGKFEATWDEAATMLQKAQSKAEWSKGLGGSRPTMGKLVARTFLNDEVRTVLPNFPPAKYITIRFTSVFEKNKDGRESVTLIRDGARGLRMMSYFLK
jgi:Protein of unknown function (DUF4019)